MDSENGDAGAPLSEGFEILAEPQPWSTRALFWGLCGLVLAALLVSILGKNDVIIIASGSMHPAQEVQRVYTPVGGEVVGIYVTEGSSVREGDVLARIRSREAIQLAAETQKRRLAWERARFKGEQLWPEKRKIRLEEIEARRAELDLLRQQAAAAQEDYAAVPEKTRIQHRQRTLALEEARKQVENQKLTVQEAAKAVEDARDMHERYQRLLQASAVSEREATERTRILDASVLGLEKEEGLLKSGEGKVENARLELQSFLTTVGSQLSTADSKTRQLQGQIRAARVDLLEAERAVEDEERLLEQELRTTQIDYETMHKVQFENIDADQCLKLQAPCPGEVTTVALSQVGQFVESGAALVTIGPAGVGKVLEIKVRNKDRGFVKVGQRVKIKLDAFPHQRYGMLEGELAFLSPDVTQDPVEGPGYIARVRLKTDTIFAEGEPRRLNYGMTATAEIVVRRQRLISYALDPFKRLAGERRASAPPRES